MKAQKTITALVIGLVIRLAVWSATHDKEFALTGMLLLFACWIAYKNFQSLKSIRAEISRRYRVGE
ncbi:MULTISPECIES: hypothetical protein [Hymenobacter]|uniref:Uncharacterized protein n=2 Tax=Hymenobacter TaxID=89966 RepID=A0A7Y7PQB1_9BACT|nr:MULTISPECIES: hypothetical protein [Hymenobacter]NVO32080.1 hypothetical protein [Hymenobacter lapidiphilus]NVO86434.1 hypothetical protein [Hymenobacter terrestris]